MDRVNLDALIPREDFEVTETNNKGTKKDTISIEDLKSSAFFLMSLNKPDFQRETTDWDIIKITKFIKSYVNGELIPAIILWRSSCGSIFVIDGSHRLSSLIAWINDDYGDGLLSRKFYNGMIPDDNRIIADKARRYVSKDVGSYESYRTALENPTIYEPNLVAKAKGLGSMAIQLQWIEGDIKSAESSFFNINQQGAPIDQTEIKLLQSRRKPYCIAARAIMRNGEGYKYWAKFTKEKQIEIEALAKEIYKLMFTPFLTTPIKTLDVPMCGKASLSVLPLVFEFVRMSNKLDIDESKIVADDIIGDDTIRVLKNVRKIAKRINSIDVSSFGLHPIIYFYGKNGAFRVASFYAVAKFVIELDNNIKKAKLFIRNRREFERFLFENSEIVQIIFRKARGAKNGVNKVTKFYFDILALLDKGICFENLLDEIRKDREYYYLPTSLQPDDVISSEFSTERKSEIFIIESVANANRCKICGGLLHINSISIDHIIRKEDGGIGSVTNGQITHPFCNSTIKN